MTYPNMKRDGSRVVPRRVRYTESNPTIFFVAGARALACHAAETGGGSPKAAFTKGILF